MQETNLEEPQGSVKRSFTKLIVMSRLLSRIVALVSRRLLWGVAKAVEPLLSSIKLHTPPDFSFLSDLLAPLRIRTNRRHYVADG